MDRAELLQEIRKMRFETVYSDWREFWMPDHARGDKALPEALIQQSPNALEAP